VGMLVDLKDHEHAHINIDYLRPYTGLLLFLNF
jgi:hypothetical protein